MNPEPIISVCIPTYNRAKLVDACVAGILSISSYDFEVVVSDNASTDETVALLEKYTIDKRFYYYRNDINVGYRNIYDVMKYAHGKYCILLSDEDDIIAEKFIELINILKSGHEYGVVLTDLELKRKKGSITFRKGIDTYKLAVLVPQYMSGIVFLRKALNEVDNRIEKEEYCFLFFPHQYVSTLVLENYDGMILQSKICILGARRPEFIMKTEDMLAPSLKHLSTKKHWYPSQRWNEMQGCLKLADRCAMPKYQKAYTAICMWRRFLESIVRGYVRKEGQEGLFDEDLPWGIKGANPYNARKIVRRISKCIWHEVEKQLLHMKIYCAVAKYPSLLIIYMKGIWNMNRLVKLLGGYMDCYGINGEKIF